MSVSLPVIVGAGAVIVALLCIGVTARRRRLHADPPASVPEPVEAVFVDDLPAGLESFVPSVDPPHSEPARAVHAHVYPVHKLQQAGAEAPITFGPTRQSAPPRPAELPALPERAAPKLEGVRELEPEVVPVVPDEPVVALPVEQEPAMETTPVTEAAPTAEVAILSAQIEVLAETIARLTDRLDAVASFVVPSPASQPQPVEVEAAPEPPEPEPVLLRSVAAEPEAEFALEAEWNTGIEPDVEAELVSVTEPAPYARKRVDDDLLAWPSDEDLERFSSRHGRRDI